ncbi:MAG: C2 family cysteine protease, partial [Flammeovirgaceae bacterium]
MWAPMLEKAWAKVKGNYAHASGGYMVEGLRALTGAPS